MRYYSIIGLFFLFTHILCNAETQSTSDVIKIKVVTEESYPLQYSENGKIIGPATTLVEQVLNAANISYEIEIMPWARAYRVALNEPNVLIYSLAKTPKRTNEFKWVGEIMALEYYLYGSVDSHVNQQTTLEELKEYRIGTIRDSAVFQYLNRNNFKNLSVTVKGMQNIMLLNAKRIDLFPANKSTFKESCLEHALNCKNIVPVYKLDMPAINLFMAFSQLTDDALVEKARDGYNQVISERKKLIDLGIN
ncbi:substrate-binding periplasmic protein [Thalassotalea profundi]|uniref:Solute-binding protein family 3/N-terminal domain-containing protein n=1 Tax=Thalassotalea profundi TaxID=2036687 RepID=A0ABQ3IYQ2_9GAMM|nr:transporter substrate-binding domain-containing protein [Thalassotalea profundi]GHE95560.1 hypothetical protein GCM10011501_26340 [Thalassotalea profundi]